VSDTGEWTVLKHLIPDDEKHLVRLNDGEIDSRGRLWFGSIDKHASENPASETSRHHNNFPLGCLYRYDSDGTLSVHEEGGVICSNGIGWSPDETKMYFTDSVAKVFLFPFSFVLPLQDAEDLMVRLPS